MVVQRGQNYLNINFHGNRSDICDSNKIAFTSLSKVVQRVGIYLHLNFHSNRNNTYGQSRNYLYINYYNV
ncbi:unnamed protein product [Rhizophagus irregularis]|nr:unnamed protein product [Rhizophagus irregularis]